MKYTPDHAAKALEIMERLLPTVPSRAEYLELVTILRDPHRWKYGHDVFDKIRVNITLPNERAKAKGLHVSFAYVAECAAKTAFNCSNPVGPFDEDSFEWLLRNEKTYLEKMSNISSKSRSVERRVSIWKFWPWKRGQS